MALVSGLLQTDLSLTELESLYQEVKASPEEVGRWFNLPGNDYSPANVKKTAERASARLASIRKLALKLKSMPADKKIDSTGPDSASESGNRSSDLTSAGTENMSWWIE